MWYKEALALPIIGNVAGGKTQSNERKLFFVKNISPDVVWHFQTKKKPPY